MIAMKSFTCAACKGIFFYEQTEEEIQAEYAANFPGEDGKVDHVCDACYQRIFDRLIVAPTLIPPAALPHTGEYEPRPATPFGPQAPPTPPTD